MSVFELPIKEDYIPTWGTWESIREVMQNGLDENDRNFPLTVKYSGGWLTVTNQGADMSVQALLIGHSDKRGRKDMRGNHGEGLALAFLSGVRSGYEIKIETQGEFWSPSIEYSEKYDARVLFVKTRKRTKMGSGVTVKVKLPKEDWVGFKRLFVSMREIGDDEIVRTEDGSILFDKESMGMVYCNGIFVQKRADFRYGYDLKNIKLDRDRSLVNDFDLKWTIGNIYSQAAATRPEVVVGRIYTMLKSNAEDVRGMSNYNTSTELREEIAERFKTEHGNDAVPVDSIGDSSEMEHYGKQGVVVNDSLKKVLEDSAIDSPSEVKRKLADEAIKTFSWHDLDGTERTSLKGACAAIDDALELVKGDKDSCDEIGIHAIWASLRLRVMDKVTVVEFRDEKLRGTANPGTEKIQISRAELASHTRALRVLVHEVAHIMFKAGDGEAIQSQSMEELWTLLYYCK